MSNPTTDQNFKEKQATCFGRRKSLQERATPAEIEFSNKLDEIKLRYIFQKGFLKDFYCIVDFYLPKIKLCIEIDGEYHLTPEQKRKDDYRTKYLNSRGFKVLRFTNKQAFELSANQIHSIIENSRK